MINIGRFWQFVVGWLIRKAWIIALAFLLVNLWFNWYFNIVAVLFVAGSVYEAWVAEKEKLFTRIFFDEYVPVRRDGVFWVSYCIEVLILCVGLHYLLKGVSTVTGVTEQWFGIDPSSPVLKLLTSVGFIVSFALAAGMMILLYQIAGSPRNRRLVIAYLLVDLLVLMPFNFMFCYENNQQVNLTAYYRDALQPLHDQISAHVTQRYAKAAAEHQALTNINQSLANELAMKKRELADLHIGAVTTTDDSELDNANRRASEEKYQREMRSLSAQIAQIETAIRPDPVREVAYLAELETKQRLDSAGAVIRALAGGKIGKAQLSDSVGVARKMLLEISDSDSLVRRDSVARQMIDRLKVTMEAPTDGFFKLIGDLLQWAIRKQPEPGLAHAAIPSVAQAEWDARLPQKRWFSFLFSALIDLFPLVMVLCYGIYARQLKRKENRLK